MSKTKTDSNSIEIEKIKTAKLTLEAMGVKPEDLVTIKPVSLEIKIRLDYQPEAENPVKVELVNVESVTDKSNADYNIDKIREFILQKAENYSKTTDFKKYFGEEFALKETITERYFGYKSKQNPRRYSLIIEPRSDDQIAISIDENLIQNNPVLRLVSMRYMDFDSCDYWIYIYPTPEDENEMFTFFDEYELGGFFNRYKTIIFDDNYFITPEDLEMSQELIDELRFTHGKRWYFVDRNNIYQDIPEDFIDRLENLNCASVAERNSRFSYMFTWLMPIEYCQSFLDEMIEVIINNQLPKLDSDGNPKG